MDDEPRKEDWEHPDEQTHPEPPERYDPNSAYEPPDEPQSSTMFGNGLPREVTTASRYMLVGAIAGPLSMLIGGTLLGTVALILSIIGYRKASACRGRIDEQALKSVMRFGKAVIAICILTLVANVVFMIIWYPTILEWVSTGDTSGLIGGGGSSTYSGNSTWG